MSRWKCHQLPGNIKTRSLFLDILIVLFFLLLSSQWLWLFYQRFYIAPQTYFFQASTAVFHLEGQQLWFSFSSKALGTERLKKQEKHMGDCFLNRLGCRHARLRNAGYTLPGLSLSYKPLQMLMDLFILNSSSQTSRGFCCESWSHFLFERNWSFT